MSSTASVRLEILTYMVRRAPSGHFGRTQVMKLFFFLQELKGVDLGYDFTLFTYGPFDSEVLSDLSTARGLGNVTEETVLYTRSYGFRIEPGPHADTVSLQLERQYPELVRTIDETVQEFGTFGAGELELRSTILFVDREFLQERGTVTSDTLVDRVWKIKPYFDRTVIVDRVSRMQCSGHLQSLSA